MTVTQDILGKAGYTDHILTMQNLLSWSALAGKSVRRGPSPGTIRNKVSWLGILKVLIELVFVCFKKDLTTHIDPTLIDAEKERVIAGPSARQGFPLFYCFNIEPCNDIFNYLII